MVMIHEELFEGMPEGEGVHRWVHENMAAFLAGGVSARERAFFEAHVHECAACFEAFSEARTADLEVMRLMGGRAGLAGGAGLEERVVKGFREQTMKRHSAVRWAGMGVAAAVGLAATGVLANRLVRQDRLNNAVTEALAGEVPGMPGWVRGETEAGIAGEGRGVMQTEATHASESDGLFPGTRVKKEVGFNFTNASADTVLDYLASAGGYRVIRPPGGLHGIRPLTIMSRGPVTPAEGVMALNAALQASGYSAGMTDDNTIVVSEASTYNRAEAPVHTGNDPSTVANTDEVITQVIPVKSVDAVRLRNELLPGLSPSADSAADAASNSIIVTDKSKNVRKVMEAVADAEKRSGSAGTTATAQTDAFNVRRGSTTALGTADDATIRRRNETTYSFGQDFQAQRGGQVAGVEELAKGLPGNAFGTSAGSVAGVSSLPDTNAPDFQRGLASQGGDQSGQRQQGGQGQQGAAASPTAAEPAQTGGMIANGSIRDKKAIIAAGGINGAAAVTRGLSTDVGPLLDQNADLGRASVKANYGVRLKADAQQANNELYGKNTYAQENLQRAQLSDSTVPIVSGDAVRWRNTAVAQADLPMTPPSPATRPASADGGTGVADATAAERKVIRNGTVEFEVRSFDDAAGTIEAVVKEEGGFVSSTSSDRLANGKIRGSVVVRVPPEHLDRMLLKIRGIGELKNQQIAASDVTKQYTDIESELRALRAMEGRLIDLIKNGKGEVKDLVEAEKQLGEYRVRIEKLEGEIRYYNNLVGMATLTITAYEKDIQKAAAATEQETGTIDVQTEEIEAQYAAARKIVEEAKGRVVDSGVRKGENDQTTAFLIADVPADKAEGVMAGLRSLGTVTRFERARKQTTSGGTDGTTSPGLAVEQKDSRVTLSLSNLASVPPRETMSVSVATADVGAAYQAVLATVRDAGAAGGGAGPTTRPAGVMSAVGRVASSQLTGNRAEDMVGSIQAEVRAEQVEKVLSVLRGQGVVMSSTVSQSASGATTGAKEGMSIMIVSAATVPPRETMNLNVAAGDVGVAYEAVLSAMREGGAGNAAGRVVNSQLSGKAAEEMTGTIQAEVKTEALAKVLGVLREQGAVLAQAVTQNSNGAATTTKEGLSITVISAATIAPRRTTTLGVEVGDVTRGLERIRAALPAGAKMLEDVAGKEGNGRTNGRITVDVPVGDAMKVLSAVRDLGGEERVNSVQMNPDSPDTKYAKERISVTLSSRATILSEDKGVWVTVRAAMGSALAALSWSLYLVLTGLLFLLPWAVVLWGLRKVWRRRRVAEA
jgi:type II secretory pathway component GspD/PulD (secretin)/acetolactate synthase regulatory subunit